MKGNRNIRLAVTGVLSFVLLMLLLKLMFHFPRQLFILLSGSFIAASILFWGFRMRKHNDWAHILILTFAWSAVTFSGLGLVHRLDPGGWIWYRLTGYDRVIAERPGGQTCAPEEFLRQHPMFKFDEKDQLILPAGEYEFDETVIVPSGMPLLIEPGTTLKFAGGRSLISYSGIHAGGTEEAPILFTAMNSLCKWGAVGIVRTNESVFKHVRFEHARRARVNGIDFVAGLSLIETDVQISNCEFSDMFGKDAINVQRAHAVVRNSLFENVFKDGIDIDAGSGEISYNRFINCQDEGIDLSENFDVEVFGNEIFDRYGGRIAADNNIQEIKEGNTFGYLSKRQADL